MARQLRDVRGCLAGYHEGVRLLLPGIALAIVACEPFGVGDAASRTAVDPDGLGDAGASDGGASDGEAATDSAGGGAGPPAGASRFAGNGHAYLVVATQDGITWTAAKAEAESAGGYLATLTSKAESDFVWGLVQAVRSDAYNVLDSGVRLGPWLGGYQGPAAAEPAGGWQWITGEPWGFTTWAPNEPNESNAAEDFLHFYSFATYANTWSDGPDTRRIRSYVVEWEGP